MASAFAGQAENLLCTLGSVYTRLPLEGGVLPPQPWLASDSSGLSRWRSARLGKTFGLLQVAPHFPCLIPAGDARGGCACPLGPGLPPAACPAEAPSALAKAARLYRCVADCWIAPTVRQPPSCMFSVQLPPAHDPTQAHSEGTAAQPALSRPEMSVRDRTNVWIT